MRVDNNVKVDSEKTATIKTAAIKTSRNRKISWPDLMFGPVNLWTLPPADFFYRKLSG